MNSPGAAERLLIVDDDRMLSGMAAKTLRHAGFVVNVADSGEAALERFAEQSYDLVLLDVMMPGLDGYEVCQRMRAMPRGARVPILILTGLNDTGSIENAYLHGATDFITKPINWTLLSHRVRYALRASTAAEATRHTSESLARAQSLASMGNWSLGADGAMAFSDELMRLFEVPADAPAQSLVQTFIDRIVPADRDRVAGVRSSLVRHGTPYQIEFRIERFDGTLRTMFEQAAPVMDFGGLQTGIEGITQDITDRVQAQVRIRELAHYDGVTGLANRQFFAEVAGAEVERVRHSSEQCAVIHLDIDRFKGVNDSYGRGEGDAVLKVIAERLRSWIRAKDGESNLHAPREHDVLARVGANAFTLLVAGLERQQDAAAVAQRLMDSIAQPIAVGNQSLVLTASAGIAFFPGDAPDLAGLSRCAEQALHAAKAAGRAQHRFFDGQMNAHAASRLTLEAELREAIAGEGLRLHFQPKVDANTGAIVGAEALVRWQHPQRGLVPPADFISLAEETGLIAPLTDWVLEAACRHLRAWSDAGLKSIPLSVNIAASSLTGTTLFATLDSVMARYGLEPASLMLEMTETMLMRDIESALAIMEALRARGYGLSLDDFGTGYSSLSYLKRFPIDELKIDRAFVTDAARGGRDGALASAIIALGRELGLQVVAEGVETAEQSAFLLRRGCNVQQGYLFSRPQPAEAFERMLREGAIRLRDAGITQEREVVGVRGFEPPASTSRT
jgi:diguanylate cyclase (GGDEF)-like protein